jgi:hypothetical protein
MRPFECACGAQTFFENTSCLACSCVLGFFPDLGRIGTLRPSANDSDVFHSHLDANCGYRKCENYTTEGVCNWMIADDDPVRLCQACRLNNVIPDLSVPENREKWARAENAKRRLVYSLNRLALPVVPKAVDPERGLSFDLKDDMPTEHVLTGHADGLITLNLAEADPLLREKLRLQLHERYRTLLGHFRHEVGHYYWDVLVKDSPQLDACRELFGDEREDYAAALERHYKREPSDNWRGAFVSEYATSHPWEDWAETWAHYLHITDTLETAGAFGVQLGRLKVAAPSPAFDELMSRWFALTLVLNSLSRSMGYEDFYPFELGSAVQAKLAFVHEIIAARHGQPLAEQRAKSGFVSNSQKDCEECVTTACG